MLLSLEVFAIKINCQFAPWRKKVHPQIVEQWLAAPKVENYSRIGADVEFEVPENFRAFHLYSEVAKMLRQIGAKKLRLVHQSLLRDPEINFFLNGEPKKFIFPDETFPTRERYDSFEIAFPIMNNFDELQMLHSSLRIMNQNGARSGEYAGFHVHLDANELSQIDFLLFIEILHLAVPSLQSRWDNVKEEREVYLGRYHRSKLKYLLANPFALITKEQIRSWLPAPEGYFVEYNTHHKTVEVKFPASTTSPTRSMQYFLWTKGLYDAIRRKEPWLVEMLQSQKKFDVNSMASNLKLEF